MVAIDIWAVELDMQDFALQVEEVIVRVVGSSTSWADVIERETIDLSWLGGVTRSAYIIKLFQLEPLVQPNIYLALAL
jgi:hypothetical protein